MRSALGALAAILLAIVVAAAAVACSSKQASPPASSSDPAGEVTAVTGTVTATRAAAGSEARPLALAAPVFADDTVATGADAAVTIRLAHNGAAWSLDAGMARRVDQSVAWKAPASAGAGPLASAGDERTAAAGRHAEASAAGSATGEPGAPGGPASADEETADRVSDVGGGETPDDSMGDVTKDVGESHGVGGLGMRGTGRGGGGSGEGGIGMGNVGTIGKGSGGSGSGYGSGSGGKKAKPPFSVVVEAPRSSDGSYPGAAVIRRTLRVHASACASAARRAAPHATGRIELRIAVGGQGKVDAIKTATSNPSLEPAATCFTGKLRKLELPKPKQGALVVVTIAVVIHGN